jgi:hypothetical protein
VTGLDVKSEAWLLIALIKFIHILFTLSLLGSTLFCLASVGSPRFQFAYFHKTILWLALFTMITGTFLVIPKHFSFHTPWIQAAYILVVLFGSGMMLLKRNIFTKIWVQRLIYVTLITILIFVIHDAVTKTTFLIYHPF